MNRANLYRHCAFFLLACFWLVSPVGKPIEAQVASSFLPDQLVPITTKNANTVKQFAVIAPDGHDLSGTDDADLQYLAQQPPGSNHWITSIAFSHDGQSLAAGSYDTSVRVWRIATGEQTLTLFGIHRDMVDAVAFSPNDLLIASGSGAYETYEDFNVRLWDSRTGKLISTLKGHDDEVVNVSFSPDGATLASASLDGTIRLWNVVNGDQLRVIHASDDWVASVKFDASGKRLLSAGSDNAVKLWDAQTGNLLRTMQHSDWVFDAEFSPDQQMIASASRDGTVRLWETATGRLLTTDQVAQGQTDKEGFPIFPGKVAFAPSRNLLAIAFGETIELWDTQTGKELSELHGHSGQIYDLEFNPTGTLLASAGFDGTVRLWGAPATDKSQP